MNGARVCTIAQCRNNKVTTSSCYVFRNHKYSNFLRCFLLFIRDTLSLNEVFDISGSISQILDHNSL